MLLVDDTDMNAMRDQESDLQLSSSGELILKGTKMSRNCSFLFIVILNLGHC